MKGLVISMGDTRRQTVKKAVRGDNPERVPLLYAYSLDRSDIVNVPVVDHFTGSGKNVSEWGFEWDSLNGELLMGQPKRPVIGDDGSVDDLLIPDPMKTGRFDKIGEMISLYGQDRYYKANFVLSGFSIMTMLRGFSGIMEDLLVDPERADALADAVFGFEENIIREVAGRGFSAVGLADDWGSQTSLLISPELWRSFFKPRYKAQIQLAHSLGLDVYLHSCGYIADIIEDLIEIELDILNLGQPDLNDVSEMGKKFAGRICFACPVSYQTTGISGSDQDIVDQIKSYRVNLAVNGRLIGIIPEDSAALGISFERFALMEKAFQV